VQKNVHARASRFPIRTPSELHPNSIRTPSELHLYSFRPANNVFVFFVSFHAILYLYVFACCYAFGCVFFALSSVFVLLAPFYTCVLIQFGIFCCFHVLRVFLRTVVGIRATFAFFICFHMLKLCAKTILCVLNMFKRVFICPIVCLRLFETFMFFAFPRRACARV